MNDETLDARIAECLAAYKNAKTHIAAISDEQPRRIADKIAEELLHDSLRHCLAPLFKSALKGKKKKK